MKDIPPLILRITSDQHSPKVAGFAGDPWVRTPNLNALAAAGTVFDNHYCANPVCCPGRWSMMTGRLPRENGTPYFWDVLPSDIPTYASILGDSGFQTTCVGKMHFHGPDQMHGWHFRPMGDMEQLNRESLPGYRPELDRFQNWRPPRVRYADHGGYNPWMLKTARPGNDKFLVFDESVTRESILHLTDYFTNLISESYQATRPLLFEVSFKTPHCPFICPQPLFEYYMDILPLPAKPRDPDACPEIVRRQAQDQPEWVTEEMIRRSRAGYYGLVQWMDQQIGHVLDCLDQLGLCEKTFVLYTSDHGEMLGERGLWQKALFFEESARVPCLLAGPGIPAGKRVSENTSHLDLLPTLCDLADTPCPDGLRGISLRRYAEGYSDPARPVFSEIFLYPGTAASGNHPRNQAAPPGSDSPRAQPSFQRNGFMVKLGNLKWVDYGDGHGEFYDLAADPEELDNLWRHANDSIRRCARPLQEALHQLPEPFRAGDPTWRCEAKLIAAQMTS